MPKVHPLVALAIGAVVYCSLNILVFGTHPLGAVIETIAWAAVYLLIARLLRKRSSLS